MHFTIDTYLAIIGIIIGLLAIVMSVPPFVQMFWGRPKITIGFDISHDDGRTAWIGTIKNELVTNGFLKKLGVRRTSVQVGIAYQIFKSTNDLVVQRTFCLLKTPNGERSQQIELRPPLPIPFTIAACQKDTTAIYAVNIKENTSTPLTPGQYAVHIEVIAEDTFYSAKRNLIVGATSAKTHWA